VFVSLKHSCRQNYCFAATVDEVADPFPVSWGTATCTLDPVMAKLESNKKIAALCHFCGTLSCILNQVLQTTLAVIL
jgi:hypothetical protein